MLPWPAARQKYDEKHGADSGPWKPFLDWIQAVDLADEISKQVRNRAKLRAKLLTVIQNTERFSDMKPLVPIQGSAVKMWTRCLVTQRFLELHDAILYMFKWQNNKVLKTMVGDDARDRSHYYIREMDNNLVVKARQALEFITPIYMFQKFCDANHPGCFSLAVSKWEK